MIDAEADPDAPRRRRTRWRTAGALVLGFALVGAGGGSLLEQTARERLGTGELDRELDRRGRVLDATIMSSDDTESGWLVSYEYFYDGILEVGYQRVPREQGRRLRFGSEVRIEAIPDALEGGGFPASSRLHGTVREPSAWATRLLVGSRTARWITALGAILLGLWWLVRPPGAVDASSISEGSASGGSVDRGP